MVYNGKTPIKMDDLGGKPTIFGNIHVFLTNHPFRKENDLPNLHDYVPFLTLQGVFNFFIFLIFAGPHFFLFSAFQPRARAVQLKSTILEDSVRWGGGLVNLLDDIKIGRSHLLVSYMYFFRIL